LAILVLDLDHFKQINDRYGHLIGDECLRRVAMVIRKHTQRPGDTAVRFGGEEFVVLLPGTNREGACQVAEQIREDVQSLVLEIDNRQIRLTLSTGISGRVPLEDDTAEKLLEAADSALYRAKAAGRNRVEVA
jgi:diguanylate cyclase (GGDEF)-like protein